MRLAFVNTLSELAAKDKNVWLVTGDLGFSFEDFDKRFPDSVFECRCFRAKHDWVAAGLALAEEASISIFNINICDNASI